MTTATLDIDRFRKVSTLIDRGATKGERDAARARATDMARSAGMTLQQARQASTKAPFNGKAAPAPNPAQAAADMFNDIFNTPELRAERAEREIERQARCRELIEEYGSEDAIRAECPEEIALRKACKPLTVKRHCIGGSYDTLAGWSEIDSGDMPAIVRETVSAAFPMPATVAGIWVEYLFWEKRLNAQTAFEPNTDHWIWVRARVEILEDKLDTMPATSSEDIRARLDWMEHNHGFGSSRPVKKDVAWLATLRADIERMAAQSGQAEVSDKLSGKSPGEISAETGENLATVQSGQGADEPNRDHLRTARDRRRAVLAMIRNPETVGLSDREIARRIGVSPQTVSTWRRRQWRPHHEP